MAGVSPPSPNPSSDSYDRGFQVGCFLGCSPLILLVLLVVGVCFWSAFNHSPPVDDGPARLPLPRIDPSLPVAGLLPTPPEQSKAPVYLGDDLSCVPELMLEAMSEATTDEWKSRKAHMAAVALHLNSQEEDGFLKALLNTRPDLAGVPFAMGATCRTKGDRAKAFKEAVQAVRRDNGAALLAKFSEADKGEEDRQQLYQAHMAVVTQVIPVKESRDQGSLVRALASIPRTDATRALAYLAVFSTDEAVRVLAIEALAIRREEGTSDVLKAGLCYPWPSVADHAASAIVKLKRKDLIPDLQGMLDAPDPRGPRSEVVAGREETVAHEVVRVSHLRNCLLCHAPAERGQTPDETLAADVPVPTEKLPSGAYSEPESNLLVRIDVTYLRQDFSAMQKVTDWTAKAWSDKQRFDFFVRRRVLTPDEAADLRTRLAGVATYRDIAERTLCELTGHDF